MGKKVSFQRDCQKLALRVYGRPYSCLEDEQAAGISRLARGRIRFNFKRFLIGLFSGN